MKKQWRSIVYRFKTNSKETKTYFLLSICLFVLITQKINLAFKSIYIFTIESIHENLLSVLC